MQNQAQLKLTESQRRAILQEIKTLQEKATSLQWKIAEVANRLDELLAQNTAPEAQVLAQSERMLALESEVKQAQLSMLVRVRNALTPEQRETLRAARRRK